MDVDALTGRIVYIIDLKRSAKDVGILMNTSLLFAMITPIDKLWLCIIKAGFVTLFMMFIPYWVRLNED